MVTILANPCLYINHLLPEIYAQLMSEALISITLPKSAKAISVSTHKQLQPTLSWGICKLIMLFSTTLKDYIFHVNLLPYRTQSLVCMLE